MVSIVKYARKAITAIHLPVAANRAHAHRSPKITLNRVKSILTENLYVTANKVTKGACVTSKRQQCVFEDLCRDVLTKLISGVSTAGLDTPGKREANVNLVSATSSE